MKPLTKLYLKIFLLTGIPFGILMTILDFRDGGTFVLWEFLLLSSIFGLLMSWTLVAWHKRELRKMGVNEFTDEMLSANQQMVFETDISNEALLQELKSNPAIKHISIKESGGLILMKTRPSWRSWGEKLQLKLQDMGKDEKQISISSKPLSALTLMDFGKNLENISRIKEQIKN